MPDGAAVKGYPRKEYVRYQKPGAVTYSKAVADEICDRLATGESLTSICNDARMPSEKTVWKWCEERSDTFGRDYARARDFGYDKVAEQVITIADQDFTGPDGYYDNGRVQAARLQADSRRWLLSKLMPRKYGDKVTQEITGDPNAPLVTRIELVPVEPIVRTIAPRARIEDSRDDE